MSFEEQVAAVQANREIADSVNDKQTVARKEAHALCQVALPLSLDHRRDDLGKLPK